MSSTRTRDEALAQFRNFAPEGTTVYTVLRHVSQSGMTRWISAFVIIDNQPVYLDYLITELTSFRSDNRLYPRHDGVKVGGAGMDMGFHLVYTLAHAVYGDGYALNHRWL